MKLPHIALRQLHALIFLLTATLLASADELVEQIVTTTTTTTIEQSTPATADNGKAPRKLRFAWGAEINGGVDMSGHDMSALGINAGFGLEWKWVRYFGIGAEADIAVSNSSRVYPVYVNFRTDFSQYRRLIFADIRGGVAFSSFDHERDETCPYVSGGIGFTLATGRSFSSHLIVGYTWLGQKECYKGEMLRKCPGISYAQLRLGVCF